MKDLIIIGAGEFGREVHTWAGQAIAAGAPMRIKGFLDDRADATASFGDDLPVIGTVTGYAPKPNDVFICAIGTPKAKRAVQDAIVSKGGVFTTLIHPTALIGRRVEIGAGSIICPLTQLSCDIRIGRQVTFGTFSNTGHDTSIGDYAQISGSCEINGRATIDEGAYLGSHATILPRATVGAYAYVGAGSVVLRRVKARTKVFGNPAIQIGVVTESD